MRPPHLRLVDPCPADFPEIRWTGAVVRVFGLQHCGKPMRVAAWMTDSLRLATAAIVEGNGNTVLRQLLDEERARLSVDEQPTELVVWPSARSAVRGIPLPIKFEKDEFVKVILDDMSCAGTLRRQIPVRAA